MAVVTENYKRAIRMAALQYRDMNALRIMCAAVSIGFAAPSLAEASTAVSQQESDYAHVDLHADQLDAQKWRYPAAERRIRGGLPNFTRKARAGEELTVAYFGGSITAHDGWRPMSFANLQEDFPQAKLSMVNAAIGGTGSIVGVFRADTDLLSHQPDLVFIEFAVNDGRDARRKPKDVIRALEGIVQKLKSQNPDVDICFFYTLQNHDIETVRRGYAQPAVAVHEIVAEHYGIPSVYAGPAAAEAVVSEKAVFTGVIKDENTGHNDKKQLVITDDNTHPTIPHGHQFYAGVVDRSMKALYGSAHPFTQPTEPIYTPTWEAAKTIPVHGNATFSGNWEKVDPNSGPRCFRFGNNFYSWFPHLYRTGTPESSVRVRFRGSMIGIKGVQGPDSGIVEIRVDGELVDTKSLFTVYNTRTFYAGKPMGELPDGDHTVEWSLSTKRPDKGEILASYYREGNDQDLIDNPAKYEPNRFSVGQIILIGEVLTENRESP
ncbi:MAG: SGNH/GDSL hydrolase family protein [Planctomycetota bacterium]